MNSNLAYTQQQAFFVELEHDYPANPLNPKERVIGQAMVEVEARGSGVHLVFVRSVAQGRGYATKALEYLLALADSYNLKVTLMAAPLPHAAPNRDTAMSKKQLTDWYKRHGFQVVRGAEMLRSPKDVS